MRSFCLKSILAAGLIGAAALPAEVLTTVQIQVPFSFQVGNVTLPPGNYEVIQSHESGAVMIHATSGSGASTAIVSPVREGYGHQASFIRVGGKYFLNRISLGDGRAIEVPAPHLK